MKSVKPMFSAVLLGLALALAACDSGTGTAAQSVKVEKVYARAVPPGQANSAAFMILSNTSGHAYSVTAAASPVANTVELHTHTNVNGVMEMRQVPKIDIPANGSTELKPGGLHVMLIGLKQELKAGDKTSVTLTFDDGTTTTVDAPVQDVMPMAH